MKRQNFKIKTALSFAVFFLTVSAAADFRSDSNLSEAGGATPGIIQNPEDVQTPEVLSPNGDSAATDPGLNMPPVSQEPVIPIVPWHPPDYSHQESALGYNSKTFEVPSGLRARVQFWKDIYSKYTTNQGVLHDSVYIDIVYESLDFGSIMSDASLNLYQKNRAREHLIKEHRSVIEQRLRKLQAFKTADGLQGEDLRVWKMFEGVHDEKRYIEAADHGRVRFQLGQRDRFILGIYYAGRYLRDMERIFHEENLPIELTRLPFVESSFNILARSRVGASGVWQFMRRTAKPFMTVNSLVDERNDPLRATHAAARLLKQNFAMLQSWPLALTGYNHGPYGVRGIVNKLHTQDIAEIVNTYSSHSFGFASENFYSCFLAALQVERDAGKLFGTVKWGAEIASTEIPVVKSIPYSALLEAFDGNAESANLLNPHLMPNTRKGRQNIPRGTFVRVPVSRAEIINTLAQGKISTSKFQSLARELSQQRPLNTVTLIAAAGREGPQLSSPGAFANPLPPPILSSTPPPNPPVQLIAKTTPSPVVTPLPALSPMPSPSPSPTAVAVSLVAKPNVTPTPSATPPAPVSANLNTAAAVVPTTASPAPVAMTATGSPANVAASPTPSLPEPQTYKIKRGDSWYRIAKKMGVTLDALRAANPSFKSDGLPYGKLLTIPVKP